jgi:hypothetical protein
MRDEQGQTLTPHGGIWLLELKKFNANHVETEVNPALAIA